MRYFLNTLIVSAGLCLIPSMSHAATPTHQAALQAPVTASVTSKQAPIQTTRSDAKRNQADDKARYAERESGSSEAQNYRGGDTLVIGASAATAILAVILLIVLI
jgi:hypothetical protein